MAKLTIPSENLPPVNAAEKAYFVRYRIISEDRNRFSHWSPIYKVPFNFTFSVLSASVVYANNLVTATWTRTVDSSHTPAHSPSNFDVWVKWSNSDWLYKGRVSGTFMIFEKNTGATTFSIRVYIPTEPVGNSTDYADFLVFEKNNVSVV